MILRLPNELLYKIKEKKERKQKKKEYKGWK